MTVVVTQDLKTAKKWTEIKTGLQYGLRRINENENSDISEMFFTSNFDTGCNSKREKKIWKRQKKRKKNELRQKLKGYDMI